MKDRRLLLTRVPSWLVHVLSQAEMSIGQWMARNRLDDVSLGLTFQGIWRKACAACGNAGAVAVTPALAVGSPMLLQLAVFDS